MNAGKKLDAIFFDLDGTLVDTLPSIAKALSLALAELGFPVRSEAEVRAFIGGGVETLMRRAMGDPGPETIRRGIELLTRYRNQELLDTSCLYPHVLDVLRHFRVKRKIVISNGQRVLVERVLSQTGILPFFEICLGGDSGECRKPSPCPLHNAIGHMRLSAGRVLMVGDMAVDVLAGKAAGVSTCAVTYGYAQEGELECERPDYLIDDLSELIDLFA